MFSECVLFNFALFNTEFLLRLGNSGKLNKSFEAKLDTIRMKRVKILAN